MLMVSCWLLVVLRITPHSQLLTPNHDAKMRHTVKFDERAHVYH
jgi:hypothetical protein